MDRAAAISATEAVRDSLRASPVLAGVGEDLLEQIALLIAQGRISRMLRKVQLFEALADEDALRIVQIAETVTLAPGEVLFGEGEKGDTFYVVLQGRVELIKRGRDGSEQKLAIAREGEAFGEMALLNQTPRSATARAVERAELLEISRAGFNSLLGADSFPVRMLRGISKTLWATSVRLAALQAKGSDSREVVRALSRMMQKSGFPGSPPPVAGFAVAARTGFPEAAPGESAWDWLRLGDERVALAVLRAYGDELPGGYPLLLTRTLLRELGKGVSDVGRLLQRVNEGLCGAGGAPSLRVDCALVAPQDGEVVWAAAGAVPAAVVRTGGTGVDLSGNAPPLGVDRNAAYRAVAVPLVTGDALLCLAGAAPGALATARSVLGEPAGMAVPDLESVAAALPTEDPVTGEVFENTILLLRCVGAEKRPPVAHPSAAGARP